MRLLSALLLAVGLVVYPASPTLAAVPGENLLPNTTKGFVSLPNVKAFEQHWSETRLGKLAEDPVMQPFANVLRDSFRANSRQRLSRLGLTWNDLRSVPTGEVTLALCWDELPAGTLVVSGAPTGRASVILIAQVTGNQQAASELVRKLNAGFLKQGGKHTTTKTGIQHFTLPKQPDSAVAREAAIFLDNDRLIVGDRLSVVEQSVAALSAPRTDSLASSLAFSHIQKKLAAEIKETSPPDVRWFIEPFGYAEAARTLNPPAERKRGKDIRKTLASQGFDSVQGIGGQIAILPNDTHEVLYYTAIYAPEVPGSPERYSRGARMLNFPVSKHQPPQSWVPSTVASYADITWNLQEAFEGFGYIFDEMADDPGVFEAVLESLETDRNGPKVSLRNELVAHLGRRVSILTQNIEPVNENSERTLFALEVNNTNSVAEAVRKSMEADPEVVRHQIGDYVVWEIVTTEVVMPQVEVDHGELLPLGAQVVLASDSSAATERRQRRRRVREEVEEKEPRVFPNGAFTVMPSKEPNARAGSGYLMVASNLDYLKQVLTPPADQTPLASSADYQTVVTELEKLGGNEASIRGFARTRETSRPTYEAIRNNKMPTSQSILGRVLNLAFAGEQGEADQPRKQRVDGSTLPEFDTVASSFGESGTLVRTENDGWIIVGFTLKEQAPATP